MKKYKDLRAQSAEELNSEALLFEEGEAKLSLQSDILATKKSLSSKRRELTNAKKAFPFNSNLVIQLQVEVEGLEDGMKRLEELQKELF